jgi:hypothetical protein
VLLIDKRNRTIRVALPAGLELREMMTVDEASGEGSASTSKPTGGTLGLTPFAVVVAKVR